MIRQTPTFSAFFAKITGRVGWESYKIEKKENAKSRNTTAKLNRGKEAAVSF